MVRKIARFLGLAVATLVIFAFLVGVLSWYDVSEETAGFICGGVVLVGLLILLARLINYIADRKLQKLLLAGERVQRAEELRLASQAYAKRYDFHKQIDAERARARDAKKKAEQETRRLAYLEELRLNPRPLVVSTVESSTYDDRGGSDRTPDPNAGVTGELEGPPADPGYWRWNT